MISTTWTAAPAGFLGMGGSDLRPYAVEGSAVPVAGAVARPRADEPRAFLPVTGQRVVEDVRTHNCIAPNDGTTLGIHPPRRPQS